MGHKFTTAILASAAIGLFPLPVQAAPTAEFYMTALEKGGQNAQWTKSILHSYVAAFEWSNAMLSNRGDQELYCQPPEFVSVAEQNVEIFKRFVKDAPASAKEDAAMVMLFALQRTFPCPDAN